MPLYTVINPCKIAGKIHKPGGKPIEASEAKAEPLVESGSLEPVPAGEKKPAAGNGKKTPDAEKNADDGDQA